MQLVWVYEMLFFDSIETVEHLRSLMSFRSHYLAHASFHL
jgi:hypothetical protein